MVTRTNQSIPRIDEIADGKLLRKVVRQAFRIHHQVVVQVATVGVDEAHLLGRGSYHVRMTVTHVRHIVDAVQVLVLLLVVHVLPLATHYLQWVLLKEQGHRPAVTENS